VFGQSVDLEGTHLHGDLSLVVLHEIDRDGETLFLRHHVVGDRLCVFGDSLDISHIEEVADFEVATEALLVLLAALLGDLGDALILIERGFRRFSYLFRVN